MEPGGGAEEGRHLPPKERVRMARSKGQSSKQGREWPLRTAVPVGARAAAGCPPKGQPGVGCQSPNTFLLLLQHTSHSPNEMTATYILNNVFTMLTTHSFCCCLDFTFRLLFLYLSISSYIQFSIFLTITLRNPQLFYIHYTLGLLN